jgi:hypothetical protein
MSEDASRYSICAKNVAKKIVEYNLWLNSWDVKQKKKDSEVID